MGVLLYFLAFILDHKPTMEPMVMLTRITLVRNSRFYVEGNPGLFCLI